MVTTCRSPATCFCTSKAQRGRAFSSARLLGDITTGQRWDGAKPQSTVNIAFTHRGLQHLQLPDATLLTFPVEFQQGMKHRAEILGDCGVNSPEHWDEVWREDRVDAWLGINGVTMEALRPAAPHSLPYSERQAAPPSLVPKTPPLKSSMATDKQRTFRLCRWFRQSRLSLASNVVLNQDKASFYPTEHGLRSQPGNCCWATRTKQANCP